MATKRTGKPRGRPQKHKAASVKKEAHRPAVPFLEDPDRWLVALILNLHWHGGYKMRFAATRIAELEVGNEVNVGSDPEFAPVYERCPSGMEVVTIGPIGGILENGEFKNTFPGSRAVRTKGRADTLRKKANAALRDPSNQFWLTGSVGHCPSAPRG